MVIFVFRWLINHLIFFRKLWNARSQIANFVWSAVPNYTSKPRNTGLQQPSSQTTQTENFWQGKPSITIHVVWFFCVFVRAGSWQGSCCTTDSQALPLRKSIEYEGICPHSKVKRSSWCLGWLLAAHTVWSWPVQRNGRSRNRTELWGFLVGQGPKWPP